MASVSSTSLLFFFLFFFGSPNLLSFLQPIAYKAEKYLEIMIDLISKIYATKSILSCIFHSYLGFSWNCYIWIFGMQPYFNYDGVPVTDIFCSRPLVCAMRYAYSIHYVIPLRTAKLRYSGNWVCNKKSSLVCKRQKMCAPFSSELCVLPSMELTCNIQTWKKWKSFREWYFQSKIFPHKMTILKCN